MVSRADDASSFFPGCVALGGVVAGGGDAAAGAGDAAVVSGGDGAEAAAAATGLAGAAPIRSLRLGLVGAADGPAEAADRSAAKAED